MNGYTDQVSFHINGKRFIVNAGQTENSHASSLLVDYIRREAALTGTKFMCREGGCGACVVTVKVKDPATGKPHTSSINACLTPVLSCDGWDITTVERLGNHKEGYNIIQKRLVDFSGTQCGYCTPGMVMNMYGLMKSNPGLTAKEIEDSFDGNICRCTGFRPILDAFKSLAPDASEEIKRKCAEFEQQNGDICKLKNACCKAGKCLKEQNGPCGPPEIEDICKNSPVNVKFLTGQTWSRPTTLREALDVLRAFTAQRISYRIVAGNTSTGIFKHDGPFAAYMDVNGIADLRKYSVAESGVVIGAGVKLTRAVELLKQAHSTKLVGYEYGDALAKHWLRVANVPVRNAGTIAGNLMIKHAHEDFPSDIYLTLQALGATLSIASAHGTEKQVSIAEFLRMNMAGQIIVSIHLPSLPKSGGYVFRSYKITKRYQNAHAYVNGAMVFKVDAKFNVTEKPRICFGGINPSFVHANATETYLFQKSLADPTVVQAALKTLEQELDPDLKPPDASPQYRKNLARNLLYKTILGILRDGDKGLLSAPYASGGGDIEYKLTKGKQTYDTYKEQWPLTQPVPKLEAPIQCSGEAEYINDIRPYPGELFGAFVTAKVGKANLKSVDAAEALKLHGVVGFVSAKDIRGPNNYIHIFGMQPQEIFAQSAIVAAGQPIGLVLAESRALAFDAVKKVKVEYEGVAKPVLTVQEALKAHEKDGSLAKMTLQPAKIPASPGTPAPKHKIRGEFEIGPQYHFHMELQTVLCVPKEGGMMDVFSATQFVEQVQASVASAIGVPNHNVKVEVRRLGGGFGAKGSAATMVATAAAIGASVTNRPVRVVLDLDTNMEMIGKRTSYLLKYEVGFDDSGKIGALQATIVADMGHAVVEPDLFEAVVCLQNCYEASGWEVTGVNVTTNKARSLYCRAPGTTQGIAMSETIMEHVAHFLRKDPLQVRLANLVRDGNEVLYIPGGFLPPHGPFHGENLIPSLIEQMKVSADFERRKAEVAVWNKANRWVKKGLSVVPMRYPQLVYFMNYPCYVAIYHVDGSVIVSHAGIEMGQGINTKAAQTVAHALGIALDKVKVLPTDNVISANAIVTGGAVTSELVCWASIQACKILKERMEPVRAKQGEDVAWEKLVAACYSEGIDLRASYLPTHADGLKGYNIWALNVTEVEVDILTGQFKIARVDVIQDAGKSMSPEVDIGQVEGSLMMGIGLYTLEKLHFDEHTGELLTNNTWEYKPPFAKDIPEDLRITLLANAPNPIGVHGSKSTGEPPLCTSVAVVFAIKQAIDSARQDAGNFDHYQLNTPVTPESIVLLSLAEREHLKIQNCELSQAAHKLQKMLR